jgi:hypothetical protein
MKDKTEIVLGNSLLDKQLGQDVKVEIFVA